MRAVGAGDAGAAVLAVPAAVAVAGGGSGLPGGAVFAGAEAAAAARDWDGSTTGVTVLSPACREAQAARTSAAAKRFTMEAARSYTNRLKIKVALCPPKPKEFDRTAFTRCSLAVLAT